MRGMDRNCPGLDLLAGWVEGSLDAEDRVGVTAHLATCDECRRAAVLAKSLDPAPARAVDEALLGRVVARARRRPAWIWAAAAAAAVLLAVLLRPSKPAPIEPPPAVVKEAPVAPKKPEAVVVIPTPAPAPQPEPAPEKKDPEPPKPAPPVVAQETPRKPEPEPPVARVDPTPAPPKPEAGRTETDLSTIFTAVFVTDAAGDLWLQRDGTDAAKVVRYERSGMKDFYAARAEAAGFLLDTRASVMLEKGGEGAVSYYRPDGAYAIELRRGAATVSTEGTVQNWRLAGPGGGILTFAHLNGRLALEPRGDGVAAILLEGKGEVTTGSETRKAEVGREVVLSREGRIQSLPVDEQRRRRMDLLSKLRPALATEFAASFDEKKDEVRPWPYALVAGRLVEGGPSGFFLQGEPAGGRAAGSGKTTVMCGIKPERPIVCASGMVLKFRYRTTSTEFSIRLGEYTARFTPGRGAGGKWAEGQVPLTSFEHEGVAMSLTERIPEVRFEAVFEKSSGPLDVDAVQFLRRLR